MIYFIGETQLNFNDEIQKSDLKFFKNWIESLSAVEVDIETVDRFKTNLFANPYMSDILCIQFGNFADQFVIEGKDFNFDFIRPYLESERITKFFTNGAFDLQFFYHKGIYTKNVVDVFLVETCLTLGILLPKGSRGYKGLVKKYIGVEIDKSIRNSITVLNNEVVKYSADDVKYMQAVYENQKTFIRRYELERCVSLENNFLLVCALASYRGFYLNKEVWNSLSKVLSKEVDYNLEALNDYVIENGLDLKLKGQGDLFSKITIDWNSPKQVANFFEELGIDCKIKDKKTKLPKLTVEAKIIARHAKNFPIVGHYIAYKEAEKAYSTYGPSFLKYVNPVSRRVHTRYQQIVDTGRMSSSDPNLQNIPKEDRYREAFQATDGRCLVISDYSAQEPKILADVSGDPNLINFFLNGDGDIHSFVASKMYSIIENKEVIVTKNDPRRQVGKVLNLKLKIKC